MNGMENIVKHEKLVIVFVDPLRLTLFYGANYFGNLVLSKYRSKEWVLPYDGPAKNKVHNRARDFQKKFCVVLGINQAIQYEYIKLDAQLQYVYGPPCLNEYPFENNKGKDLGFFIHMFSNSEADTKKLERLNKLKGVAAVGLLSKLNQKLLEKFRLQGETDAAKLKTVFSKNDKKGE